MSQRGYTMRASPSLGVPLASKKNPAMPFLSPPVRIRPNILDECGHSNSSVAEKKHRKRGGKGQARPAEPSCFPEGGATGTASPPCNKDTASNIASLLATAKAASLTDEVPLKGIILANRRSVFHKTRMCPRQRNRSCPLGDSCTFAHSEEELRPPPVLDRTRLCPSVLTSGAPCPRANGEQCRFAHSKAEIRHTANMFKTNMCLKWNRGKCKAGEGCNHAHGEEELRFYRLLAHANGSRDFRSEAEAGALRALKGAADQSKGGQQRLQALLQAVGQSPKGGDTPSRRKGRRGANSSLNQRKPMVSNASKSLPSGRSSMPHPGTLSSDEDQEEPTMYKEVPISTDYFRGMTPSGSGGLPVAAAEAGSVSSQGEDFFKLLIGLAPHAPELVLSVVAQHLAEGLPLLNSQQTQAVASALASSAKPRLNAPLSKMAGLSSASSNTATSACGTVLPSGTVRASSAIHEAGRGGKATMQVAAMPVPCCNLGPRDVCQEDEYAHEHAALYALGKRAGLREGGSASPVSLSPALSGLGSVGLGHYLNNRVSTGRTAGSGTPDSSSTCASLEESADRLGSLLKVSTLLDDETRQGSLSPLPVALTPPEAGEMVRGSRAEVGVRGEGDFGGKKRMSLPYLLAAEEMERYLETNDVNSFAVASSVDGVSNDSFMSLCQALRGDAGDGFCQEMKASAPLFCPSIQSDESAARATDKQEGGRSAHMHEREGGVSLQEAVTLLQSLGLVDGGRRSTRGDQ
ncbi:zinc finger (ccch type) motif-containing protein [Cystoisospora suis]|uniref:Zinc finger (Ccch type) motif-containing protein n=1 Tax=Cystoisospora suis TaxID=483139 RepID=A0A2C6LCD0_9APIC|nr:zinc finger (ccch type) motif-containing protein [Cystoisospora suis]